jgi:hypothetical protein
MRFCDYLRYGLFKRQFRDSASQGLYSEHSINSFLGRRFCVSPASLPLDAKRVIRIPAL